VKGKQTTNMWNRDSRP